MADSLKVRIEKRKMKVVRARKQYNKSVKDRNALIAAVKRFPNQKRNGYPIPKKEVSAAIAGWKKRVHEEKAELDKQKDRLRDLRRRYNNQTRHRK